MQKLLERPEMGQPEEFITHSCDLTHPGGSANGIPATLVDLAAQGQGRYLRGIRTAPDMFARQAAD